MLSISKYILLYESTYSFFSHLVKENIPYSHMYENVYIYIYMKIYKKYVYGSSNIFVHCNSFPNTVNFF